MTTTSSTIMFAHDGTSVLYPCGPGRVFAITFDHLSRVDGGDEDYQHATARCDLRALIAAGDDLAPLDLTRKAPQAWTMLGNFEDDLADAVEGWADYCDRLVAAEDGEVKDLPALLDKAA